MVHAEQVQQRGVIVGRGDLVDRGAVADLVGFAVGLPAFDAAAG